MNPCPILTTVLELLVCVAGCIATYTPNTPALDAVSLPSTHDVRIAS